jgi:hypothetical protein
MGVKSFEALAEADPRKIELVTGRKYPFGNHIKDSLLSLPPKVDVKLTEIESHTHGKSKLVVTLTKISQSGQLAKRHYADMVCYLNVFLEYFSTFNNLNKFLKFLSHRSLVWKKTTLFSFMKKLGDDDLQIQIL